VISIEAARFENGGNRVRPENGVGVVGESGKEERAVVVPGQPEGNPAPAADRSHHARHVRVERCEARDIALRQILENHLRGLQACLGPGAIAVVGDLDQHREADMRRGDMDAESDGDLELPGRGDVAQVVPPCDEGQLSGAGGQAVGWDAGGVVV